MTTGAEYIRYVFFLPNFDWKQRNQDTTAEQNDFLIFVYTINAMWVLYT